MASPLIASIQLRAPPAAVEQPLGLDAPDAVWLVCSGALDVFAQRRDATGRTGGALHHVYRAWPGALVLGVDCAAVEPGWDFIAAPLPGTTACRLDRAAFAAAADGEALRAEAVALLCDWVSAATRGPLKPLAPKRYTRLNRDGAVHAAPNDVLSPGERVVWLSVSGGSALWLGRAGEIIDAEHGPLPLMREAWIRAETALTAELVDPLVLLADGRIWHALALHHRFVLRYALASEQALLAAEAARVAGKAGETAQFTRDVWRRLMTLESGATARQAPVSGGDPLAAAFELIGAHLHTAIRMPAAGEADAHDADPVTAIAAASALPCRAVVFNGEWWRTDNGALLGSIAETREWVVLLPDGNHRYLLHRPGSNPARVDAALARTLAPFGYAFYRPLPETPLALRDALRFAASRLPRTVVKIAAAAAMLAVLGMLMPLATAHLIDTVIPSADRVGAWQIVCVLVGVALASSMFDLARTITMAGAEGTAGAAVQAAVWDRVLRLPVPFFRAYTAGDLAARINGLDTARRALSESASGMLLGAATALCSFALLVYYSTALAAVAALLALLALSVMLGLGYLRLRHARALAAVSGRLAGSVFQYLRGIAKLRAGAAESRAFANWAAQFAQLRNLEFAMQRLANIERTFFAGYPLASSALIFGVIGMFLFQHHELRLSTGDFIAFNTAFGTLSAALLGLGHAVLGLLNLLPAWERAKPLLETAPETLQGRRHPGELQGGIDVVKLVFRYGDGPEILGDISFSVRPGGFIALVGPSGSGKSTLFRLLLGFEKPASGSIYYDAQDLAELDLGALRRQLGVVLQPSQLISGDIFTNIAGGLRLSMDEAWDAARRVGLDEDINRMPMGMHTAISEGASMLSGGQRQRILIARAIVRRPRIIFFDEATSMLDNRTQALVTESLNELKATRIVIAHRLSTVIKADRILVLQDGRIVQNGSYEKLLREDGPFAELAKAHLS